MSKFELTGEQRDLVRSYAIHQDFKSLWAFIEDLVDKQEQVFVVEDSHGPEVDKGSDQASGSAAQAAGSSAGAKDPGQKAGSRSV